MMRVLTDYKNCVRYTPRMHRVSRRCLVIACLAMVLAGGGGGARAQPAPPRKKLLFLTHAALYKHSSLAAAERAVSELGANNGIDVTTLEGYKQDSNTIDLGMISPDYLAQDDGLMLMTNGNLPLTPAQKRAIVDYVRDGHGLVGVHCASLTITTIRNLVRCSAAIIAAPSCRPTGWT